MEKLMQWRDIETAPKDRRSVLMYGLVKNGPLIWIGEAGRKYGNSSGVGAPTHWMPLPDPPARTGGQGE